jgi:diguanylate cyclase (GGDEF)-like protein
VDLRLVAADDGRACVLVVGDCGEIRSIVDGGTGDGPIAVLVARDAAEARTVVDRLRPDVAIAEFSHGIDICRAWRRSTEFEAVPIVLVAADSDVSTKVRALDEGATDCVPRSIDAAEFRARLRAMLRDKRRRDALAAQAQLDGLTGLWNRGSFDRRLADEITHSTRHGRPVSLIMLDIDCFKQINDAHGHRFGDSVLHAVAQAIRGSLRQGETAFRYGGEEFAVIVRESDVESATVLAERLRRAVANVRLPGLARVTASFGVADLAYSVIVNAAVLIDEADRALYSAKRAGRNRVCSAGCPSRPVRLPAVG